MIASTAPLRTQDDPTSTPLMRVWAVKGMKLACSSPSSRPRMQSRPGYAEPGFLALHIAACRAKRVERIVAVRFGGIAGVHAADEQHAHDGQHRPAWALIADHAAEHIGQCRPNAKIEIIW